MDKARIFNSWWFFKLKPLQTPGEIRSLVYFEIYFKIEHQRRLVALILGQKTRFFMFCQFFALQIMLFLHEFEFYIKLSFF